MHLNFRFFSGIGIFVDKFAKNFDGVDNRKNLITNKIGTNVFGPYGMLASTVLDGLGSFMGNLRVLKKLQ
jgi:hypothetical protein